jgi:biotin operon repressor
MSKTFSTNIKKIQNMSKTVLGVELLSIKEVVELLGISRVALNKYINEEGLEARTIGGRKYVAKDNLRRFLLSRDQNKKGNEREI